MNKHIKINGVFTKENNQEITEQEQLDLLDAIVEVCQSKGYEFGGGTKLKNDKGDELLEIDLDSIPKGFDFEITKGMNVEEMKSLFHSKGIAFKIHSLKRILKISFDFDQTLSELPMQELAKKYIKLGAEVYITTSRAEYKDGLEYNNSDLFEVTDKLGIKRENITFTNYDDKYKFVKAFDIHFDDDEDEISLINEFPNKCIGFLYQPNFNNQIADF